MQGCDLEVELINVEDGRRWSVSDSAGIGYERSFYAPCFSPEGSKVAVVQRDSMGPAGTPRAGIVLIDNDGGNVSRLCELYSAQAFQPRLSWSTNGYIYWSEGTKHVYRANTRTGVRETVCDLAPPSDIPDTTSEGNVYFLSVARDGKRAASVSNGIGKLFALDLATCSVVNWEGGGCRGTISADGSLLIHPITMDFPAFPGGEKITYVERYEDRSLAGYITAPAVKPFEESNNSFFAHRFSQSSNHHIVCLGGRDLEGRAYVYDVRTNTYAEVGRFIEPWDLWIGDLPAPASGPAIALEPTSVHLASMDGGEPSPALVSVLNIGERIFTPVDVTVSPNSSWLSAVRSGSGNEQTVSVQADPAGLAEGAYFGDVTVSGGGAPNAATCRVSLNVGLAVMPPTGLSVAKASESSIVVAWEDNADNESGFVLERRSSAEAWAVAGTTSVDQTWLVDEGLTAGATYAYRVRAVAGVDSSTWSNTDSLSLAADPSIRVIYPYEGAVLSPGASQRIGWSAESVTSVAIEYSLDGGDTWTKITGGQAVLAADSLWNNYPWIVPDTIAETVLVRVSRYGAPEVQGTSGLFSISNVGVSPRVARFGRRKAMLPARYMAVGNGTAAIAGRGRAVAGTRVYRLDGTYVGMVDKGGSIASGGAVGTSIANGCYIVIGRELP